MDTKKLKTAIIALVNNCNDTYWLNVIYVYVKNLIG